jgi:hypothetical protein
MHRSCPALHIDDNLYNDVLVSDLSRKDHDSLASVVPVVVMLKTVYVVEERDRTMRR